MYLDGILRILRYRESIDFHLLTALGKVGGLIRTHGFIVVTQSKLHIFGGPKNFYSFASFLTYQIKILCVFLRLSSLHRVLPDLQGFFIWVFSPKTCGISTFTEHQNVHSIIARLFSKSLQRSTEILPHFLNQILGLLLPQLIKQGSRSHKPGFKPMLFAWI